MNGYYVVGGTLGPGAGQTWKNLEDAKTYKRLIQINYPTTILRIYQLVLVDEEVPGEIA